MPGLLTVGNSYELTEPYKGCFMVNNCSVRLSNFESPIDIINRLVSVSEKMIISEPKQGLTVELLITDNYLVCYSHTKGNHWNIGGNHYKYYHDLNTGNYISVFDVNPEKENVYLKCRLLKADYKRLVNMRMAYQLQYN